MTPRHVYNSRIFRLPWMREFDAICLGRWIFFAGDKPSATLLRHEMIHQNQMDRLTVPGFYCVYLWHWFKALIRTRSFHLAYRENPLEREAYERQS